MDKLGIQPTQLITQIVNFAILAVVLTKILYKPVLKSLEERRKKIASGLEYAEKARLEAEKGEKKRLEVLVRAKEEGKRIVEESKKAGKQLEEEIVEKAHLEAVAVMDKAKQDIQQVRLDMEKGVQKDAVELATAMVERLLPQLLSTSAQKELVDKKLQLLSKQVK
jgi:F-type H+-transporting ATPase subunit b